MLRELDTLHDADFFRNYLAKLFIHFENSIVKSIAMLKTSNERRAAAAERSPKMALKRFKSRIKVTKTDRDMVDELRYQAQKYEEKISLLKLDKHKLKQTNSRLNHDIVSVNRKSGAYMDHFASISFQSKRSLYAKYNYNSVEEGKGSNNRYKQEETCE